MRDEIHPLRLRISFLLSVILIGIPFIGSGYVIAAILSIALAAYLFMNKELNLKLLNHDPDQPDGGSGGLFVIRPDPDPCDADTPMNQNAPKDIFTLRTYLAREQYGQTPLLYGQTYVSEIKRKSEGGACVADTKEGDPVWTRVSKKDPNEKDRYYVSRHNTEYQYVDELNMLFPRMYSSDGRHVQAYKEWAQIKGQPVKFNQCAAKTNR